MVAVLGIDVQPALLKRWAGWLAPDPQPFLVGTEDTWPVCSAERGSMTKELIDTYQLYGVAADSRVIWVSEERFHALPKSSRAALVREQVARKRHAVPSVRAWADLIDPRELRRQADGHRFVWWPSLVATNAVGILSRVVATERLASRHREVAESTWTACRDVLPAARRLAGTFPAGSTTCCYGTVMAAARADDSRACASLEPFSEWLATACRKGGDTGQAGTVLVWFNRAHEPVHAAVTIGDGWALEKPSGDWHSPRAVATVADVMRKSRHPGERLERYMITS